MRGHITAHIGNIEKGYERRMKHQKIFGKGKERNGGFGMQSEVDLLCIKQTGCSKRKAT